MATVTALLLAAGACILVFPRTLPERGLKPQVLGMAWELVAMAREDPDLGADLAFMGDWRSATGRFTFDEMNPISLRDDPPLPARLLLRPPTADKIQSLYFRTAARRPGLFLRIKTEFALHTLGIAAPLLPMNRGMHGHDAWTKPFGGRPSRFSDATIRLFYEVGDRGEWIVRRPIVGMLLVCLALVAARWRGIDIRAHMTLFAVAAMYYASFFLNTQAMEWRYYSPTFFVFLIITIDLSAAFALTFSMARTK